MCENLNLSDRPCVYFRIPEYIIETMRNMMRIKSKTLLGEFDTEPDRSNLSFWITVKT